jgi:L-amino acid N-acyltransferase YncA
MSEDREIGIRMARAGDAGAIAEIYVDSWRETYAGLLPTSSLARMSKPDQTRHWQRHLEQANLRNPIFVASDASSNLFGFASAGPTRDQSLRFEAEIYTLYVAPGFTGQGIGTALMSSIFHLFSRSTYKGMIIWALADNPSRFFYETMGGKIVAERMHPVWGEAYREIAYGWDSFEPEALAKQSNSTYASRGPQE